MFYKDENKTMFTLPITDAGELVEQLKFGRYSPRVTLGTVADYINGWIGWYQSDFE